MRGRLRVELFDQVPYAPMLLLQQQRHADVLADRASETLFLLEHTPVVTLGKNASAQNVLLSREALALRGVEMYPTGRGGDVTYHGPGQIVGYPIIKLGEGEQDIKRYAWRLEEIVIRTLSDFEIEARRIEGMRGIWVTNDEGYDAKIGAIGVRVARWVTMHGFALNVSTNLSHFDLIVPCGISDKGVTSLQQLLGSEAPSIAEVQEGIIKHTRDILEREPYEFMPTPLPVLGPGEVVQDVAETPA